MKTIITLCIVSFLGFYPSIYTNAEPYSQEDADTYKNTKKELAIVRKSEDGPYPYYMTSFYFIELDSIVDIYLDIEEIGFYENFIINDTVLVSYKIETEYRIKQWDESNEGDKNPEWEKLTGKLTGAYDINVGDTYDELEIENKNVPNFSFNYYTDSEMVELNNTVVTVYYTSNKAIKITKILLTK